MKGTEYFVSLRMSVVITEECNVMVNSEGVNCYCRMSDAMYWVLRKLISLHPGLTLHKHTNICGLCVFDIGHIYRTWNTFYDCTFV
jgi:hypothetical protein